MKYISSAILFAMLLCYPVSQCRAVLSADDIKSLTKKCQLGADDARMLMELSPRGQEKIASQLKKNDCSGFKAFQATRKYIAAFQKPAAPAAISMPPKNYDRDYVSEAELQKAKSAINKLLEKVMQAETAVATPAPAAKVAAIPPLKDPSQDEIEMYQTVKDDSVKSAQFIATRKFYRKAKGNPASLTKEDTKNVKADYALDLDEQLLYIQMLAKLGLSSPAQ